MSRRRPVPREWREEHHYLSTDSRRSYGVMRGSGHYTRAGGHCSCGAMFGTAANDHTCHAADVRDEWMDHVEQAYHERYVLTKDGDGVLTLTDQEGKVTPRVFPRHELSEAYRLTREMNSNQRETT